MPKSLLFCFLQSNFKILGIGSAERSWGDLKKIKSGKISAPGSIIYEMHSIVNESYCIESERIGINISIYKRNYSSLSHSWNEDDDDFEYQSEKWGVENSFKNFPEKLTR